jgi:DeoR family transcriptional regulator of aga operon
MTTYSESEAHIAKMLIKRSEQTFAVFDRTKVGRVSLFSIAPLSAAQACITDAPLDPVFQEELERQRIRVHVAD